MPLAKGDPAPRVTVRDAAAELTLPYPGVANVLFFYPTNRGRTCVTEVVDFNERRGGLTALGVEVAGITTEDIAEITALKTAKDISISLCFDFSGKASELYGVRNAYGFSDRYTFLISKEGVVLAVWQAYDTVGHAQEVLRHCQAISLT